MAALNPTIAPAAPTAWPLWLLLSIAVYLALLFGAALWAKCGFPGSVTARINMYSLRFARGWQNRDAGPDISAVPGDRLRYLVRKSKGKDRKSGGSEDEVEILGGEDGDRDGAGGFFLDAACGVVGSSVRAGWALGYGPAGIAF